MELFNSKPFKIAIWILLISVIIYMGQQIAFVFKPVVAVLGILVITTLLSVILYSLFHPVVDWLERYNLSRIWSVNLIYLGAAVLGVFILLTIGVAAYQQFMELIDLFPRYIEQITAAVSVLEDMFFFRRFLENGTIDLDSIAESISQTILNALPSFRDSVSATFSFAANTLLVFILLPFVLFYMLKDGHKLYGFILERIPHQYQKEAADMLEETSQGLASFIKGQVIVITGIGMMAYIGFLIIGIRHPLILALIVGLTNVIPYIGPIIGSIPALIVGMVASTAMAGKVLLLIVIIQLTESVFIRPQIMGRTLYIHPLSILVLLLVAGRLAGLLGLIFAIPMFIILKIASGHLYGFIKRK